MTVDTRAFRHRQRIEQLSRPRRAPGSDAAYEGPTFSSGIQFSSGIEGQTLAQLATWFVGRFRSTFDGWPSGIHYMQEEHEPRLRKIRWMLPGRLAVVHPSHIFGYLTTAVNEARAKERKAYLRQVRVGGDAGEEG